MKKTNILLAFAIFFAFAVSFWIIPKADAVPAFARQTGLACSTCHFQHYPALNAFGRAFKAGGYTQIGGEGKVEGEDLSIPDTLNASLVTKVRYQKTNGKDNNNENGSTDTNKGQLQFPDEAALLIGGRAGEHVGFLLEAQLGDADIPVFASYKMPITYDVGPMKLSVIPFTTDAAGASYGFELLNTGATRMSRVLEHRTETSAQQYIGTATAAEGFAFVASSDMFFVNYTMWAPVHGTTDAGPYLSYIRAAATPNVGGWDIGAGVQWWGGTTKRDTNSSAGTDATTRESADAYAIDAQAQGNMGLPLGVYLTYGNAKRTKAGDTANLFNSNAKDKKAWSLLAELGVLPGKATVAAGYRAGNTGAAANNKQNTTTLGATYLLAQNVELQLNYSMNNGSHYDLAANNEQLNGDRLATLMVFAAF